MPLAATERAPAEDHVAQLVVCLDEGIRVLVGILQRMRRHAPPVETSQIAAVIGRDVAVGDDQIFPAIVV